MNEYKFLSSSLKLSTKFFNAFLFSSWQPHTSLKWAEETRILQPEISITCTATTMMMNASRNDPKTCEILLNHQRLNFTQEHAFYPTLLLRNLKINCHYKVERQIPPVTPTSGSACLVHALGACVLRCFSWVQLFVTLWTIVHQATLSVGFSRQEYWSGLSFPPSGNLSDPGIKPGSHALQVDSLPFEPPVKPNPKPLLSEGWGLSGMCVEQQSESSFTEQSVTAFAKQRSSEWEQGSLICHFLKRCECYQSNSIVDMDKQRFNYWEACLTYGATGFVY